MAGAKGTKLAQLKQKAMMILKRRKMYDNQLAQIMNQQFNVDQVAFAQESIQDTLNTVSRLAEKELSLMRKLRNIGCRHEASQRGPETDNERIRHR